MTDCGCREQAAKAEEGMIDIRDSEVVRLTRDLIRIPSENQAGTEKAIGDFVEEWLKEAGIEVRREAVAAERDNIVARVPGAGLRAPLLLLAHLDTVPAGEGWETDPFGGELRAGRLYGRGACDMKGGLAASLLALKRTAGSGVRLMGDLILCATVDEEGPQMAGVTSFARGHAEIGGALVIAVEPTRNRLCTVHKGANWYRLEASGRMAHAGNAHLGADANHALAWAIVRLKERVAALPHRHPLVGPATLTAGKMAGGIKTNVVPNLAMAEIDFRLVPPLDCRAADELVRSVCAEAASAVPGASVRAENLGLERPPIEVREDAPVVQAVREGYRRATGREVAVEGFPAYTDAGVVHILTGNPQCVVFGPGDLDLAHTVNEYVDLDDLAVAERVLPEIVQAALG